MTRYLMLLALALALTGCATTRRPCLKCEGWRARYADLESYAAGLENEQNAMAECWHQAEARAARPAGGMHNPHPLRTPSFRPRLIHRVTCSRVSARIPPSGKTASAMRSRTVPILCLVYVLFVLYGSLAPFDLCADLRVVVRNSRIAFVAWPFGPAHASRVDMAANVALYAPLGALVALRVALRRGPRWLALDRHPR